MSDTPRDDGPAVDLDQAHRVLIIICLALAGGVAVMAGVALMLLHTGAFPPFLGFSQGVRVGIALFLALLLAASYPVHRMAGGAVEVTDAASALQAFQTRVITAMAMREFVGIAGSVLILLSRDMVVGGSLAALSVFTILLALPRKDDLREAVRRAR
ncbi:MAG TPA: hypothetical protein VLA43_04130 [Longimicrobiales bacterium]|nr:hypothetical protein [Longimicrobiales bacterium]